MLEPYFTHDKTCCQLVGHYKQSDIYYCLEGDLQEQPSYIIRYGNGPSEYSTIQSLDGLFTLYERCRGRREMKSTTPENTAICFYRGYEQKHNILYNDIYTSLRRSILDIGVEQWEYRIDLFKRSHIQGTMVYISIPEIREE